MSARYNHAIDVLSRLDSFHQFSSVCPLTVRYVLHCRVPLVLLDPQVLVDRVVLLVALDSVESAVSLAFLEHL